MSTAKEELTRLSRRLLEQVGDRPMGPELEQWLNLTHPPGSELYERLAALVVRGMHEGWACRDEIYGPEYRRCQIRAADEEMLGFSIESVYMNDTIGREHEHPRGEVNMIVPLDAGARVGDVHAGWTCPAPRSRHFPEVRGGAAIFLYYLPGGEIRFTGR